MGNQPVFQGRYLSSVQITIGFLALALHWLVFFGFIVRIVGEMFSDAIFVLHCFGFSISQELGGLKHNSFPRRCMLLRFLIPIAVFRKVYLQP